MSNGFKTGGGEWWRCGVTDQFFHWFSYGTVMNLVGARGYMDVNPKIGGKPPKWMVYKGKPY